MHADPRSIPAVTLRQIRTTDVDRILAWRADPASRRHQPLRSLSRDELLADIQYTQGTRLADRNRDRYQWIVEAGEPVGWVTLVIRSWEHLVGEVAYNLGSRHHRRGIGTAAVGALLRTAFVEARLYRLEARCSVRNDASFRLLEKLGFTREGLLREYFVLHGERVDHYFYGLLRSEWEARERLAAKRER